MVLGEKGNRRSDQEVGNRVVERSRPLFWHLKERARAGFEGVKKKEEEKKGFLLLVCIFFMVLSHS